VEKEESESAVWNTVWVAVNSFVVRAMFLLFVRLLFVHAQSIRLKILTYSTSSGNCELSSRKCLWKCCTSCPWIYVIASCRKFIQFALLFYQIRSITAFWLGEINVKRKKNWDTVSKLEIISTARNYERHAVCFT
jgi:hypothetical protein